ncbi:hypothetical protein Leryth_007920 [Lithospermum erythrorhizon]|nr:hypothetical protein Leryth_007920 [Lithospermum erythrorhizon]
MTDMGLVKDIGSSGGIGLQSNRSVCGVFSDTVAEFPNSAVSPTIEDDTKDLNKELEKLVHGDSVEGQSFGGEATAGTSENHNSAMRSIKTANLDINEQVKDQVENYNPFSEAIIEDSPAGSVGVTALHFDASPVGATRESPEPYLNEIDKQASYNLRGESLTTVADIEKESKLESKENKSLDFVTRDTLFENDNSPLKKCLDMENSEEAANLVRGDAADQNKMNKIEESDDGRKQCSKRPLEDQLAANGKRTQGADSSFLSEVFQITSSLKVHQSQVLKESPIELSELLETIEKFGGAVEKNTEVGHKPAGPEQKSSDLDLHQSDFDSRGNMEQSPFSSCMSAHKLFQEITASQGKGSGNVTGDANHVGSAVEKVEVNQNGSRLTSDSIDSSLRKVAESYLGFGTGNVTNVAGSVASADSMHVNWGPVSAVYSQSDAAASGNAGGPSEKSQAALSICKGASECHSVKSDDFEPPCFMLLVEKGNNDVPLEATPSDLSASSTEDPKAGLFPPMSNVVNESYGRKENEEIIAKASNLSTGREHTSVKSLLGKARSLNLRQPPSATQNDNISLKNTDTLVTTVESILRSEVNDKKRNSPPVEIKKEKRKHWLSFVCCSSVDRDL